MHDDWIRPHGGDVLAVVLVYLGLRSVTRIGVASGAITAFATGCLVEIAQRLDLLRLLGLTADSVSGTVLGSTFDWSDILAYGAGALTVLFVERLRRAS